MATLDRDTRRRLRALLVAEFPWLDRVDVGPRSVDAGECDRCRREPRLLTTCGPSSPGQVCATCAVSLGVGAWCAGHEDDAREALSWAAALPSAWPAVTRLWWVATGEVDLDPDLLEGGRLAALVSRAADPDR